VLESGIERELRHVLRTSGIVPILRRDRRKRDPILQPLDRFVVTFRDLAFDIGEVVGGREVGTSKECECRDRGCRLSCDSSRDVTSWSAVVSTAGIWASRPNAFVH
jgi:hypothetical protein